jgi:hypothetical protein
MKSKRHAMRQFRDRYRPSLHRLRLEHGEVTAVIGTAVDSSEQIIFALTARANLFGNELRLFQAAK